MKHVNDRISPTPMSTNLGKVWEPGSCLHMNPPISSIFRRASNIIPPWSGGGLSVWPNTDFPPSHVPKSVTTLSLSSQFRDLWGAPSWGTPSSSRWSRKCLAKPPNPAIPSLLAGVGSVCCTNTSHRRSTLEFSGSIVFGYFWSGHQLLAPSSSLCKTSRACLRELRWLLFLLLLYDKSVHWTFFSMWVADFKLV